MIRFEHVTKRYEETDTTVFEDLDLTIERGEFILLTGKSGSGKSTLIRLLLRDTDVSKGRILVFGQDISRLSSGEIPFYRRKIGTVFQEPGLMEDRTVYENVEIARLIAGGRKKDNRKVITALFSLLGITDLYKRYPAQLSGGERQKVCLARALVNYPSILLADEPTGNLSGEESREIMQLFSLIHRQGITVITATHDRKEADGLPFREIAL